MPSAEPPVSVRISFLDVLRVFAFVSVLVGHKFYPALQAASSSPDVHGVFRLLAAGVLPFCRGGRDGGVAAGRNAGAAGRLPAAYVALALALQVTGPWFTAPGLAPGYLTGAVFFAAWALRSAISPGKALTRTSELTYAVYLLHNWVWPHLDQVIGALDPTPAYRQAKILGLLLVLCALAHHLVERPFIRIGARLAARPR